MFIFTVKIKIFYQLNQFIDYFKSNQSKQLIIYVENNIYVYIKIDNIKYAHTIQQKSL